MVSIVKPTVSSDWKVRELHRTHSKWVTNGSPMTSTRSSEDLRMLEGTAGCLRSAGCQCKAQFPTRLAFATRISTLGPLSEPGMRKRSLNNPQEATLRQIEKTTWKSLHLRPTTRTGRSQASFSLCQLQSDPAVAESIRSMTKLESDLTNVYVPKLVMLNSQKEEINTNHTYESYEFLLNVLIHCLQITCISIYIYIHTYTYTYIYIHIERERESIYTHHHISSKKTNNFHPQPISPKSISWLPHLHGRRDVFHQAPSPQDRQNNGGHADHPGIALRVTREAWNASWHFCWQIYTYINGKSIPFIKHGLGNSGIVHVHNSRSPKFDGPYEYGHNWGLPPPDMPTWWTMMCVYVCVQKLRGYLKLALWVWMGKMWFSSFKLVQTIKL